MWSSSSCSAYPSIIRSLHRRLAAGQMRRQVPIYGNIPSHCNENKQTNCDDAFLHSHSRKKLWTTQAPHPWSGASPHHTPIRAKILQPATGRQVPIRTMMMMALKKRPKKIPSSKFKGGGSIANNRNTVKLMFCHTHYDVENHDDEDDEEELYGKEANADAYYEYRNRDRRAYDEELDERMFRCPFDLAIIRKIARQEFGMEVAADASASSNSLEYYHAPTLQWKPLIDLEELQSFQRDNKPIPIRDPSHFDDEILFDKSDEEDETYDDEDMRNDSRNDQNARKKRQNTTLSREQIVDTIWCLAHALQEEGYIRVSNDEIQHQKTIHSSIISFGSRERCDDENSNAAISKTPHELLNNPASFKDMTTDKRIKTRDWVMLQANRNLVLYTWIVSQPGVLNHITQCLHFDMLWKKDNPSDTVSTRSG